jgi:hypothetical protein
MDVGNPSDLERIRYMFNDNIDQTFSAHPAKFSEESEQSVSSKIIIPPASKNFSIKRKTPSKSAKTTKTLKKKSPEY